MRLWQDINKAAIVGTGQQKLSLTKDGELSDLLSRFEPNDNEAALLGAAGLLSAWRLAGQTAIKDTQTLPEPCAEEDLPCICKASAQHLKIILEGSYKEVLKEWLEAVAKAKKRIPFELLPDLLMCGENAKDLRESIAKVLGKRGEWLTSHNNVWRFSLKEDESIWETGSHNERVLFLKHLRETNAAHAREFLASSWKSENANNRKEFLSLFKTNLSDDDEPFLQETLKDRSAEVRRVIADLLFRLPNSRLSRAMVEKTLPLLSFKKKRSGKNKIEVTLPEEFEKDSDLEFANVEPPLSVSLSDVGAKGKQLRRMVAAVPPSIWCERLDVTSEEIVEMARDNEWSHSLLSGFLCAAERFVDIEWIGLLARVKASSRVLNNKASIKLHNLLHNEITYLLPGLPVSIFEPLIFEALESDSRPLHDDHPALDLLYQHKAEWSVELSRVVVKSLKEQIHKGTDKNTTIWRINPFFRVLALRLPPSLSDEFCDGWDANLRVPGLWGNSIDAFQSLLQFRRDMHEAIQRED